jgi:hypothetical protein
VILDLWSIIQLLLRLIKQIKLITMYSYNMYGTIVFISMYQVEASYNVQVPISGIRRRNGQVYTAV